MLLSAPWSPGKQLLPLSQFEYLAKVRFNHYPMKGGCPIDVVEAIPPKADGFV